MLVARGVGIVKASKQSLLDGARVGDVEIDQLQVGEGLDRHHGLRMGGVEVDGGGEGVGLGQGGGQRDPKGLSIRVRVEIRVRVKVHGGSGGVAAVVDVVVLVGVEERRVVVSVRRRRVVISVLGRCIVIGEGGMAILRRGVALTNRVGSSDMQAVNGSLRLASRSLLATTAPSATMLVALGVGVVKTHEESLPNSEGVGDVEGDELEGAVGADPGGQSGVREVGVGVGARDDGVESGKHFVGVFEW